MKRNVLSSFMVMLLSLVSSVAWAQERVVPMPNRQQLASAHVRVLFQDKEGYMWYGMKSDGLYRDDGYNLISFRADFLHPDVQMNNNITAICEDNQNRLWVGTKRGLYILDKRDYSIRPTGDKTLQTWTIDALKASMGDSVWAYANKHVLVYDREGNCIRKTPVDENPLVTQSRKEITDRWGNVWWIDDNGIPSVRTQPAVTLEEVSVDTLPLRCMLPPTQSGLPSEHKVHAVWKTEDGTRLAGTSQGLWMVRPGSGEGECEPVGPNYGVVNTVTQGEDGTLYMNTEWQGLVSYKDGVINRLDSTIRNSYALVMEKNNLWISTSDGRLLLYDVEKKQKVDKSAECCLRGDAPWGIVVLQGCVWMLFNQRIVIYSPGKNELRYIFPADLDPQPLFFRGLYTDGISRVFVECEDKFFEILMNRGSGQKKVPEKIVFSAYETVHGNSAAGIDNHQLNLMADERVCHLFFTTLDHLRTQNVRFACRYDGEADWHYQEMGENDILLTNVTPGNHTLEVMATNAEGQWIPDTFIIDIYRTPNWWETTWAYMGYALAALLLLASCFWLGHKVEQLKKSPQKPSSGSSM